jgi:hypothetical protein
LLLLPASETSGHTYSVEVRNEHGVDVSETIPLSDPAMPALSLEFDGVFSVTVFGSTGRRHVLEMTDQISTNDSPTVWSEAANFRIEVDDEARIIPPTLLSAEQLFFRARVVE